MAGPVLLPAYRRVVYGQNHRGIQRLLGVPQHFGLSGHQLERDGVHLEAEEPQDSRHQGHGACPRPPVDLLDAVGLLAQPEDRGSRLPRHGAAGGLPI